MSLASYHRPPKKRSVDWITPREVVRWLGPFALDPCACARMPWPTAKKMIALPEDGLVADWGDAFVLLNPPYGREAAPWLDKLSRHNHGIALVFARVGTAMFHDLVWPRAEAVFFPRGRLTFYTPDGEPGNGRKGGCGDASALIAYGREAARRLRTPGVPGKYVRLRASPVKGSLLHEPSRANPVAEDRADAGRRRPVGRA